MPSENAAFKKDHAEEERELLRLFLQKEGIDSQDKDIVSAESVQRIPLSWAQRRLWFLDRLRPGSDFYNVAFACELNGDLDAHALERSFQEIVRRHGALRTRFTVEEGEPSQKVEPSIDFRLERCDLSGANGPKGAEEHTQNRREDGVERLRQVLKLESAKPFDLERAPLLRGLLIRLREQAHILAVTVHHIVVDEWSMGVFLQEMALLYSAYAQGQESPFKEMPTQYVDYTLWQTQWFQGEVFLRQMSYWKQQLAGMPEHLELATDRPRSALTQHRGNTFKGTIPVEYWSRMKQFSRQEGATVFMALLAVYQVLLQRYTGQADFGIGTPITSRNHVRTEGMIGFCVNTLILRADLGGDPTFRELLQRVRKATLEAFDHQDLPLEKLVEELSPERRVSGAPLFQVMFSFTTTAGEAAPIRLPGIEMRPLSSDIVTAKYDLTLSAGDTEYPGVEFNYDVGLFDSDTIERMLYHYGVLIATSTAGPELRISDLAMLTQPEGQQLLVDWNRAESAAAPKCVHELFEEQARKTPLAQALAFEETSLTYAELNRRANRLAHYLRMMGVKAETKVAIGIDRGLEMVVGLLAVLKAGGAYVPLDLSYPQERLQFILENSAPSALLVRGDSQQSPGAVNEGIHIIDVEREEAFAHLPEIDLHRGDSGVDPESLAYVIYTSGSTGEPKGSEIPHRSIPGFIFETDYVPFGEGAVWLQHSSVSWDAATMELWSALLTGGRCVLARERVLTADRIRDYVRNRGVNTLWLTAALFNSIVENDVESLHGLKFLLTGGEAASVKHIRRVHDCLPELQIVNGYGPSECTVFSSCYVVPAHLFNDLPGVASSLPIGRPIGDRRMYVLDSSMNLVPVGVIGEAFIAGAGVARGYLRRPDLTAERFVPDPYSEREGSRLYRTGDLVRWRNDGMLEFVGRNDLQVKVRGFRIELSEIEARLLELNGVREAAVVAQGDGVAERRLVAYYVARHTDGAHSSDYSSKSNGHGQISVEELRGHLAQRLPDYMVPAAYVRLDAMPLTPTGKLDRKRLPAPDSSAYVVSGYEEPQGEIEKALAAIWQEVLGVGRVGRNDNFFELGGHSLLAISVVTRLRETLGLGAELSDIFEHPRLAELAGKIAGGERAELPPIAKADRSRPIPLSYAQQRLWFLAQMQEASEVYHIPFGVGLVGNLNRRALGLALDRLVQRHEGLRTTFPMVHGEAVQRIAPPSESHFSLLDYDLRGSQSAAASSELRRLLDEEAHANFDLETGPLIRGRLIRQGENEHALLITMHHIVSDGWSMGVLLNELSVLYGALARGESDPLPELTVQYPDFAVWQRNWIQGDVLLRQSDYWKNTLSGSPTLLELPTDRARPAEQRYAGAMCDVALDEGLTAKLKQLSKEHGVTLYMTLLAGWAAMLGRLSGQQDILIGSPTANRGQGELEKLIGFFVNTLVLRVDLSGRPSVGELLKRVKGQSLGAQHHQDIPFEQVVEIVQPERSLAHSPLFQVMFAWQNAPKGSLDLLGLQVVGLETASHRVARSDLTASLWETGERIAGGVEYATALFESETVERFMEYWRRILEGMAAGSERIVDCLDILSEGERRQLLSEWNQTKAAYPQKCVHELFEEQVRTSPESVAIEAAGQRLTYRELNRRANQLARYLVRAGVGPEVRVGICMERGLEMVIGLLAILKAGGTYVPLDPNYPPERLKFMAEDSSIAALLTQSSLLNRLPESANTNTKTTISADSSLTEISRQSEENLGLPIPGESVAYVIYTSGSTGRPKGVAIRHSSANALLHWAREIYSSEDFVGVLASTSICFDLSVFEIFAPLSWGGKVIIVRDALALAEIGPETAVSLLNTVPSAMVELLRLKAVPESVRTVNLAGEALRPDLVAQIYRETKASRVFNLYGPSEDTTYSTFACLERGPAEEKVPIGKPIANTQAYVLDRELQPVPMGVTGELYLAGEGVARGYLNHPELAAERFLPNPFAEGSGERMYRTGDQARWGRDGNLEFLGRSDQQVKIRGYRIELGEIEAALQACEGVRSCVVIVREVGSEVRPEDRRLVAYIEREDTAKVHDYSSLLKSRLPDYMIPAAFVELEQLPLTANGKVDRKSLPAPEGEGIASGGYIGPRNAEEEMLSGLFAEVLNRDRIGVHDNFFAVGGHSLLATRLVSRIRTVLGINVPVRSVFESPTIAKLARLAARLQGASRSRTSLQRRVESGPALLSYSQQRLWFIDRLQGRSTEYNMAEALRLRGKLDVSALRRAVQAIVDRHEILRTQFGEVQGVPVQIVAPRLAVEIPVQDLSGLSSAEQQAQVAAFVNNEWSEPFDLATGQVLRLKLLKLAEEDHVLLRTFHHIVSDGWSLGVFMRELREFYDAYSQGMEISLPELPLQFADFAAWQNQEAKSGAQDEDLAFWKSHLAGAPQELDIPKDRPRPAMQTYVGKACGISLPAETVAGLRRSEHATLYMTLLAGFAVLMHRYSGQDDIVVGSPVANRSDERLEGLIGYFANTLVMRVKVNPTIAFSELVAEVRERALQGYRHQELPYERLLEELPLPRSLNRTPIFQVIFALQNAASQSAGAPAAVEAIQQLRGLDIEGIGNEAWTVRYDLEVHALEREGRLDIVWIYNQDLFDSWHIEQMARHYEQTLMAIPQSMRKPICDLGLLSESEAQQLITAEIRSGEPGKQIPLRAPADNLHLAPRTPMEQLLADTWRDILGLERLGLDDNFFDLGGYSLLLARVRFHLRQKLQKEIEFVDFFSYPTVRLLAEKLEHDGATGNSGAMR